MFEKLKNWWNRDKIAAAAAMACLAQYSEELKTERERSASLTQELETVTEEIGVYRSKVAEDDAKRNGVEPWVEIKSERIDPIKGIQIELDWNPAFVQYLKDNGITGRDEETAVQRWIAMLYQNLMDRLEKVSIDNSDKHRVNDFE